MDNAVVLMRKAADGEDGSLKHIAMENRLYPLRELLGDLLLDSGRADREPRGASAGIRR